MAEESSSTAGLYVLLALLIVLVVGAILYFGGVFERKKTVDIEIKKPELILPYIPHSL
ncbi:MAG TPA: hypothetical protein VID27_02630 [Blastocatellia bacterium]